MADCLYIRYARSTVCTLLFAVAEVLWIEWKRVDRRGRATKAAQHQRDWHTLERSAGR